MLPENEFVHTNQSIKLNMKWSEDQPGVSTSTHTKAYNSEAHHPLILADRAWIHLLIRLSYTSTIQWQGWMQPIAADAPPCEVMTQ